MSVVTPKLQETILWIVYERPGWTRAGRWIRYRKSSAMETMLDQLGRWDNPF